MQKMPFGRPSLDSLRRRLAERDALVSLAILAVFVGAITGMVTLAFRLLADWILISYLPGDSESFELLAPWVRVVLPLVGALLIGLAVFRVSKSARRVGVVHVMERLSRHQGRLPLRNAVVQLIAGIMALATGQSGGREGPAVHLGAASGSLLGQVFELPNNSMRTLVACGTAAAIAASFNTPIAGVIFAMEVVMMEYTIRSFIPVIISAVIATLMSHGLLGNEPTFIVPQMGITSLLEVPYIMLAGVAFGTVAAGFIGAVQWFARFDDWPYWQRISLAGAITGVVAFAIPEVMGIGYDTVNAAILGNVTLAMLLAITVAKLLTSAAAVGLGVPLGIIGPTLVVGAALGGAVGYLGAFVAPITADSMGLYVILGMGAMMAAVLQAPLAALMAVLELTANPGIIMPAMLAIVVATMVTSEVFHKKSVFMSTLDVLGLQYPLPPVTLALQRVGVTTVMDRGFVRVPARSERQTLTDALGRNPRWLLIENEDNKVVCTLRATDLDVYMKENPDEQEIKLMDLPAERKDIADINHTATLFEALKKLDTSGAEALCVRRLSAPMIATIQGIITRDDIERTRQNT